MFFELQNLQQTNAESPIESTEEGIEIDFNSSQYSNVDSPIVVKFDFPSNENFVKFEHP